MTKSKSKHKIFWFIIGGISAIYLLNLGFGVVELLPDNLPLIAHGDEIFASALLMKSYENIKR